MSGPDLLKAKGYDVTTKDLGIGWRCTLEWHNRIETFFGPTEEISIRNAARYVASLEYEFARQQELMRCEGCGD